MIDTMSEETRLREAIQGYGNNEMVLSDGYSTLSVDPATLPPHKASLLSALGKQNISVTTCKSCGSDTPGMLRPVEVRWNGDRYVWRDNPMASIEYCCDSNRSVVAALEEKRNAYANRVCDEASAEVRQQRMASLISLSMLGERWQDRTFANFRINDKNRRSYEMCRAYAESFRRMYSVGSPQQGRGLALIGPAGTGKTHLAAATTMQCLEYGVAVVFANFVEMMNLLTRRGKERDEYVDKLCYADLLVIDDLGKEFNTSDAHEGIRIRQGLYLVVNTRYERKRPIIATMNDTSETLKKKLDPAVVDRLLEGWWSKEGRWNHIVKMDWSSERTGR